MTAEALFLWPLTKVFGLTGADVVTDLFAWNVEAPREKALAPLMNDLFLASNFILFCKRVSVVEVNGNEEKLFTAVEVMRGYDKGLSDDGVGRESGVLTLVVLGNSWAMNGDANGDVEDDIAGEGVVELDDANV